MPFTYPFRKPRAHFLSIAVALDSMEQDSER